MMTGDIDLGDVERMLDGMDRRGWDDEKFLRTQRAPVMRDHKEYAAARKGPDGKAWAPRSPRTAVVQRESGEIVEPLGKLPKLLRARVGGGEMVVDLPSAVAPIGQAQQSGATVGRGAKLPARPFVGLTEERADKVAQAWAAFVVNGDRR